MATSATKQRPRQDAAAAATKIEGAVTGTDARDERKAQEQELSQDASLREAEARRNRANALAALRPVERDVSRAEEAYTTWSVRVDSRVKPEDVLSDHQFLWSIHNKIKRHHMVVIHEEFFRWELTCRVMRIDTDLQTVQISPIGQVEYHDLSMAPNIDWNAVKVQKMGNSARFCVLYDDSVLKQGFEDQEEAENWINRKKKGLR